MRKTLILPVLLLLAAAVVVVAWPRDQQAQSLVVSTTYALSQSSASLPVILVPEATPTAPPVPTPTISPTPMPSPTPEPSPTPPSPTPPAASPTPQPTAEPLPGNALVNGSFEDGWTDLPPAPGFLINQQPNGWTLSWLPKDQPLWDDSGTTAQGVPESLHKLADQLPPEEKPGGPRALILDGSVTYKMFHFGAPFGSQLFQVVSNLPPGSNWRFTVPVQAHTHGDNDPWASESGAWAITSASQSGGWVPAGDMGDRVWFYHNVEFTVPADGRVELLIRVKSKWFRAKDFFIDGVQLRQLGVNRLAPNRLHPPIADQAVTWGPRELDLIPQDELVVP